MVHRPLGQSAQELATGVLLLAPLREDDLRGGGPAPPESELAFPIVDVQEQRLGEREDLEEAPKRRSAALEPWGLFAVPMSRRRSGSRCGASLRAAFLILTVALSTVLAGCSVDVVSSSNELLFTSSSLSPPALPKQLLVSSSLATVCMQTEATSTSLWIFFFQFPCLYGATVSRCRRRMLMSVEQELDAARAAIRRAARRRVDRGHGNGNVSTADTWFDAGADHALVASVYRNPAAFHR